MYEDKSKEGWNYEEVFRRPANIPEQLLFRDKPFHHCYCTNDRKEDQRKSHDPVEIPRVEKETPTAVKFRALLTIWHCIEEP